MGNNEEKGLLKFGDPNEKLIQFVLNPKIGKVLNVFIDGLGRLKLLGIKPVSGKKDVVKRPIGEADAENH
ncbi:MAG: hypothetical protein ACMUJM_20345 [bacterium]